MYILTIHNNVVVFINYVKYLFSINNTEYIH